MQNNIDITKDPQFDSFLKKCAKYKLDIVHEFSNNPNDKFEATLLWACQNNFVDVADFLLDNPQLVNEEGLNQAFMVAIENAHLEIIRLFLNKDIIDINTMNQAMNQVKMKIHQKKDQVMIHQKKDHLYQQIFEILDDKIIREENNHKFQNLCSDGKLEEAKDLLKNRKVNLNAGKGYALRASIISKHYHVVKVLLKENDVNPSAGENFVIEIASALGNEEIVKMILEHKNFDPNICNGTPKYTAIKFARQNKYENIAKFLDKNWILEKK